MSTFTINLDGVQEELVSGTNIKTINGDSILGSGDIEIDVSSTLKTFSEEISFDTASSYSVLYTQTAPIAFTLGSGTYSVNSFYVVSIQTNGAGITFSDDFYVQRNDYTSTGTRTMYDLLMYLGSDGRVRVAVVTALEPYNPLSIGDVAFYFKGDTITEADGASVSTWTDSSLEAKSAVAISGKEPTAQTVDYKRVLRFDGTDDIMKVDNVTGLGGASASATIVAVISPDAPVSSEGDRTPYSIYSPAGNSNSISPYMLQDNNELALSWQENVSSTRVFADYYEDDKQIVVVTLDAGVVTMRINGVEQVSHDISTYDIGTSFCIGGLIGSSYTNGRKFYNGDIYEMVAYYKVLTSTEIYELEAGIATSQGITLDTPYVPMIVNTSDIVVAYEMDYVKSPNGTEISKLYPVNLGYTNRETYPINMTASQEVTDGALVLTGSTATRVTTALNGLSASMASGTTDQPLCLFMVVSADDLADLQALGGLGYDSSVNNNLLIMEKSATDNLGLHRQVSTAYNLGSLGLIDDTEHVIAYNIKSGGLLDLWVDGVKTQSAVNVATSNSLAQNQKLYLGCKPNAFADGMEGSVKLLHVYGDELTDTEIGDTFTLINSRLDIY